MGYGKEMAAVELLLIGLGIPYESYVQGDIFFVSSPKTGERVGTICDKRDHLEWTNAADDKTYELTCQALIDALLRWHKTLQESTT